jgi:hypothetical protein
LEKKAEKRAAIRQLKKEKYSAVYGSRKENKGE